MHYFSWCKLQNRRVKKHSRTDLPGRAGSAMNMMEHISTKHSATSTSTGENVRSKFPSRSGSSTGCVSCSVLPFPLLRSAFRVHSLHSHRGTFPILCGALAVTVGSGGVHRLSSPSLAQLDVSHARLSVDSETQHRTISCQSGLFHTYQTELHPKTRAALA